MRDGIPAYTARSTSVESPRPRLAAPPRETTFRPARSEVERSRPGYGCDFGAARPVSRHAGGSLALLSQQNGDAPQASRSWCKPGITSGRCAPGRGSGRGLGRSRCPRTFPPASHPPEGRWHKRLGIHLNSLHELASTVPQGNAGCQAVYPVGARQLRCLAPRIQEAGQAKRKA